MVGSAARILVSSAIAPCSSGTLKSTRTNTRRPLRSRSAIDSFPTVSPRLAAVGSHALLHDQSQQVHATVRVAPLVVVPGADLHEIAIHHLRVRRVDNRRMGVALEVDRNQRLRPARG